MSFDRRAGEAAAALRTAGQSMAPRSWVSIEGGARRVRLVALLSSGLAVIVLAVAAVVAFGPGRTSSETVPAATAVSIVDPATTAIPTTSSLPSTTPPPSSRIDFMTGDGVEIASIVDGVLDVAPGWEKVVDHAREELINRRRYGLGETEEVRQDRIGGCPAGIATCDHDLVVTLTVEPAAQALAEEVLEDWFAESEVDGSIVLLRNASGAVVAGAETATFIVPGENRPRIALWSQGRRQAGSLATPLAAVAALEAGYDLDSMWPASSPHEIPTPGRTPEVWTCRNAGGDGGPDEVTLREAIVLSITTAFCQLSADVGPEAIAEAMERIGVVSPLDAVLSIPLGTNSVGPLEMAASYATLVNDGERHDAVIIESVAQTDGTALAGIPRGPGVVVDPAIAGAIVDALQDVVSEGTGTNADIGRPVAGKTGTVQNYRDAWFVGSTPEYTAVVWVGYSESQTSMEDVEINGTLYRRVFGGTVPAPIWAEFMSRFLEGEPVTSFDD